jgi:hypothetical protein
MLKTRRKLTLTPVFKIEFKIEFKVIILWRRLGHPSFVLCLNFDVSLFKPISFGVN